MIMVKIELCQHEYCFANANSYKLVKNENYQATSNFPAYPWIAITKSVFYFS